MSVAVDTLAAIDGQLQSFLKNRGHLNDDDKTLYRSTQNHVHFQLRLLRNLQYRSQANEKRIHNEISFV